MINMMNIEKIGLFDANVNISKNISYGKLEIKWN